LRDAEPRILTNWCEQNIEPVWQSDHVTFFSGARTGANDSVMNAPMVVEGRLAASRTRVLVLSEAFDAWLDHRRKADTFEQYASQIDTIEGVIRKSVDAVTGTIPKGSEGLALVVNQVSAARACRGWGGVCSSIRYARGRG
jgi:hypothetical protein